MSQSLTIESLQARLTEYRKTRSSKKGRIPEEIWLDACVLCEEYKPYLVAKALGLSFASLKKRIEALSGEFHGKKGSSEKSAAFVDLGTLSGALGKEISLEVETRGGIKIRLQCSKYELTAVGDFIQNLSRSAA